MPRKIGYCTRLPEDSNVYETRCPVLYALDLIGGKWKLPVLWHLAGSPSVRYNELKRRVLGVTNLMLTKALRELERDGLVERHQFPEVPPHVEYSLTDNGRSLLPCLRDLYVWGEKMQQLIPSGSPSGPDSEHST